MVTNRSRQYVEFVIYTRRLVSGNAKASLRVVYGGLESGGPRLTGAQAGTCLEDGQTCATLMSSSLAERNVCCC